MKQIFLALFVVFATALMMVMFSIVTRNAEVGLAGFGIIFGIIAATVIRQHSRRRA